MLRGLSTTSFFADDLEAAKRWYTELFGIGPYFEREGGYIEFRIGDFQAEFGIVNSSFSPNSPTAGPAGAIVYWAVDDLEVSLQRLLDLGATPHEGARVRGDGYATASVVDPFGNILGIMYNVHYLAIAAASTGN